MELRRAVALILLVLSGLSPVAAQSVDTTETQPLFEKSDLYYAGGFAAATIALFPLDKYLAHQLQDSTTQANELFNTGAKIEYLGRPGSFIIGGALYAVGRISGNDRMADLGLHGSEALILTEILTRGVKALAGRARPSVDLDKPHDFELGRGFRKQEYQSFPSGHTSSAFTAAAVVTAETGEWWPDLKPYIGTLMYGGATLVGLSRMYHNRHWATDVVIGAAIGTFSGWKVVRWAHTHRDSEPNRWLLGFSLEPESRSLTVWLAPGR